MACRGTGLRDDGLVDSMLVGISPALPISINAAKFVDMSRRFNLAILSQRGYEPALVDMCRLFNVADLARKGRQSTSSRHLVDTTVSVHVGQFRSNHFEYRLAGFLNRPSAGRCF